MAEIFLDGEAVHFDGPPPASLQDLIAVIERALADSGRVLVSIAIDGSVFESVAAEAAYGSARRIDITSLSMAEAVARVVASCAEQANLLKGTASEMCQAVLREPWPEIAPRLLQLGERLGGLFQELAGLGGLSDYAARVREMETALSGWMDAVSAHDAASVCLSMDKVMVPFLDRLAALRAGSGDVVAP